MPGMLRKIARKRGLEVGQGRQATQIRNVKKSIKKINRAAELKQSFITQINTNLLNTGDIEPLTLISVGDTGTGDRDGNQIVATSLQWRARFRFTSSPTGVPIRHIVFWDRQPNGVTITATNFLSLYLAVANDPISPPKQQAYKRFKILADKIYNLTCTSASTDHVQVVVNKKMKRFHRKIQYDSSVSATVPVTNALYSVMLTDQALTGANVEVEFKLLYKDY